jgi:hypothetical protein|tara:strand:- start:2320 stop:2931 length:612 start_codon:yes stop_codon:yes gene_type:complete
MDKQLQNMLMQQAIVVHQEVELSDVLVGFDSANKYSLHAPNGQKLAQSAETGGVGGFFLRQIFRNSRAANVKVFGMNGAEIAEMRKPFKFIFAEMAATIGGQEIGRAKRLSWFGRDYGISVMGVPTFTISSSLLQWKNFRFNVMKGGVHVATIMKRYEGALKMIFTQADTFTIEFHDSSLSLEERFTLLGTTYLIDFDCFEQR